MSTYSNVGDSNFFSGFGDISNEDLKQFENEKEKIEEDINISYNLERDLSILMADEDEDPKIIIDNNENSNLSSLSNLMKNNLINISAIISENNNNNTNNKLNQKLDVEDKAYYNISNNSNNYPSFSKNINAQNYENNKPNNIFHLSQYSFGSYKDFDKIYLKNNPNNNINNINNNINNNVNKINQNWNVNFNINNNNYFGEIPQNLYNCQMNNNQSYDFYTNAFNGYSVYNSMNSTNNKTFINNNTFVDNPINFNNYYKKPFNKYQHKTKSFKKKRSHFSQNQNINNYNENGNSFKKSINNQNNASGFSKFSNSNNNNKVVYNKNEKMIAMIKDKNNNKNIQKKIEEKSPSFLHKLYKDIKYDLYDIMNDQYGNYVIQTYIENCDKQILSAILKQLYKYNEKSLYEISVNKYGTRALQKLFEKIANNLKEDDIALIKTSLRGNITSMIKNINGNHVVQSIIENIKNEEIIAFVYKEINQNLIDILKTKPGYCVFLKMIKHFNSDYVNNIFENILNNIDKLINDEYGNFIIQSIIKINNPNYNNKIFNYINDKIVVLGSQKYGSKVIECLLAESNIKIPLIKTIIEGNFIKELILDQYGNYIVQNSLIYFKDNEEIFLAIINEIKKNIYILQKGGELGQKIYDRLKKNYGQYLSNIDNKKNI